MMMCLTCTFLTQSANHRLTETKKKKSWIWNKTQMYVFVTKLCTIWYKMLHDWCCAPVLSCDWGKELAWEKRSSQGWADDFKGGMSAGASKWADRTWFEIFIGILAALTETKSFTAEGFDLERMNFVSDILPQGGCYLTLSMPLNDVNYKYTALRVKRLQKHLLIQRFFYIHYFWTDTHKPLYHHHQKSDG